MRFLDYYLKSAGRQIMKQRWLWHLCGALATFWAVVFCVAVTTPLANALRLSWSQAVGACALALLLSLIATIFGSKRWYPTIVAAFLILMVTLFGRV